MMRLFYGSPTTIAGTVYGTVGVLAVFAAEGKAFEHDLWGLTAIVVITVVVLSVSRVYARGLAESLQLDRRLDAARARRDRSARARHPAGGGGTDGGTRARCRRISSGPHRRLARGRYRSRDASLRGVRDAKVERLGPTGALVRSRSTSLLVSQSSP